MRKLVKLFGLILLLNLSACKNVSETETETETISEATIITSVENPAYPNSSLPRLFSNGDELFFSWVTKSDTLAVLNYAKFSNNSWTTPEEIISGSDWFVNWADFPAIAVNNGNILTSFLQKSATGTYTYDVKLNMYSVSNNSWNNNFLLHDDGTESEHGFVAMQPYGADGFLVTWLDGRNTVGGTDENHDGHGGAGAMTIRSAVVLSNGVKSDEYELDARVCDCCSTSVAETANGPIIAYRDRSEDEIRDISIVRWEENAWSVPQTVGNDNWKIPGCPVNGPSIAAFENSVAVVWFTAADELAKVQVAFSEDNGVTFGNPVQVDGGNPTGRVDIVMLNATEAAVIWMEPDGDDELIRLVKVTSEGQKSIPVTISKTSAERASGFPQMEKVGERLFIAWTVVEDKKSSVKMATVLVKDI